MRLPRLASLFALLLLVAGCKSADELYSEGQDLELRGGYEAAAYRYADAVEKQPDLQKARGRLLEAGKLAVASYTARIDDAEVAGRWVDAGDLHFGLDRLAGRAAEVGVPLPLPADYAEQRRANFEAAVTTLLDEGAVATERGDFEGALAKYDYARRFGQTGSDEADLAEASASAYIAWAQAAASRGEYRASYDLAGQALGFVTPGSAAGAQIRRMQTTAIELGSLRAALAPVGNAVGRDLPRGFLTALNDALDIERWTQPPPFVLVIEPALVRRGLRDLGLDREPLRTREAADLGRTLGVDAVFAGAIDDYRRVTEEKRREERTVRTRSGDRATYLRIEDEVTLSATVAFEIVDVASRRTVCAREVERSVQQRVERGEFSGSLRTLDLDRSERRLFDADEIAEREREIEDALIDVLTVHVAEAAYACLLQGVR